MVRTRGDLKVQEKYDKEVGKLEREHAKSSMQVSNTNWRVQSNKAEVARQKALKEAHLPNDYEKFKEQRKRAPHLAARYVRAERKNLLTLPVQLVEMEHVHQLERHALRKLELQDQLAPFRAKLQERYNGEAALIR